MKKPNTIFAICSNSTGEVLHQFEKEEDAYYSLPYAWNKKSISIYKFKPKLLHPVKVRTP